MFVLEVISLAPLPPQIPQLLSYFHTDSLPKGAIVEIMIGNRKVPAVVASSSDIERQKAALKKSGYQLKKISSVISDKQEVGPVQFKIALWLARNYFSSLSTSLKTVLPAFFNNPKYPMAYPVISKEAVKPVPSVLLVKASETGDKLVREIKKFAGQKKQVLVLVPEVSVAEYLYGIIAGYYETVIIHGKLGLKKHYSTWNKIFSGEAEVIIGTRQSLFSPFADLGLVIVEDPANSAYKSDMSPKYNSVDLALKISELYSSEVRLLSRIPDIRSYSSIKAGGWTAENIKIKTGTEIVTADMARERRDGNYSLLCRELKNDLIKYLDEGKKVLLFSSRKGYASSLTCSNCNYYFKCPDCSIPLKVYKLSAEVLICNRCSVTRKMPSFCPNCNSNALKAMGYPGSEKVREGLIKFLDVKDSEIVMFDSGTFKNLKSEMDAVKKMAESDSYVCIATQSIFSHRFGLKFDLAGIINLDGLTSIPDYKADEELFYQFGKILDFGADKLIVQTFNPEASILDHLKNAEYEKFYDKELQIRKIFRYPPYARLARLSFSSAEAGKAAYEARILSEKLKMAVLQRHWEQYVNILGPSPAFILKERGKYIYNLIIKIMPGLEPAEIIKFVPGGWNIDIDPRSIL